MSIPINLRKLTETLIEIEQFEKKIYLMSNDEMKQISNVEFAQLIMLYEKTLCTKKNIYTDLLKSKYIAQNSALSTIERRLITEFMFRMSGKHKKELAKLMSVPQD